MSGAPVLIPVAGVAFLALGFVGRRFGFNLKKGSRASAEPVEARAAARAKLQVLHEPLEVEFADAVRVQLEERERGLDLSLHHWADETQPPIGHLEEAAVTTPFTSATAIVEPFAPADSPPVEVVRGEWFDEPREMPEEPEPAFVAGAVDASEVAIDETSPDVDTWALPRVPAMFVAVAPGEADVEPADTGPEPLRALRFEGDAGMGVDDVYAAAKALVDDEEIARTVLAHGDADETLAFIDAFGPLVDELSWVEDALVALAAEGGFTDVALGVLAARRPALAEDPFGYLAERVGRDAARRIVDTLELLVR